jgi:hypothetical protein
MTGPIGGTQPGEPAAGGSPLVEPTFDLSGPKKSYKNYFAVVYAVLGVVLFASVVVFVVVVVQPGHKAAATWSSWRPTSGATASMASQIANHVSHEYKLNAKGPQLVAVVPSKPTVTSGTQNISIRAIAIRKAPQSNNGIEVLTNVSHSEMYTFCGLGDRCSIAGGSATRLRGRLVRREALEVALYTFKFIPSIESVIAFMPPPPGTSQSSLLFLRKENFKNELKRPLKETLRLRLPPLPTQTDALEATTIDQLTLPSIFSYELTALQTGGAALVLDPAT